MILCHHQSILIVQISQAECAFRQIVKELLLCFQIDDVTAHQSIVTLQIVVLHQLLPADIELFGQRLKGIPVTGYDIAMPFAM